ncbi:TadE/TadG family type IV pilus assembly protein [Mesorhizobium sp. M7A.F.Ca.MR.245.00.0.0]|uniref:TadE/TadG family type IV pilus assembly protein n=1 Tax=Mesorhizobium sp. M7A.F.Ca.MR.245.00.0.0 TaxID=2496778 RepID=UPI000FCC726E|nr:TadE/TadG family type IV pilus assembly protein [Mesorhizobium sp. M7A.F.Ca.MR.245.00.0.0]RUV19292.1 pilus assembly protein [Mesorhizobium sp. M7A.F.Ca.MR.245.00.0.0]
MTRLGRIIQRFQSDQGGAALVEVAITVPLVLLLSAGVFEFSNILNTRLLLSAGVEDAARYMARCSDSTWNNCVALGKNLAVNGAVTGGSARVTGWTTAEITVGKTSTAAVDGSGTQLYLSSTGTVDVVQVSTALPYSGVVFWDFLGFGTIDITASHQERVVGW